MTYPVTDAGKALIAAWNAPRKPDGHAPITSSDHWAWGKIMSPEYRAARAEYDKEYFAKHPEEREKYGYKGP